MGCNAMISFFTEINHINKFILFISKSVLIVPSLSASLFPLIVTACYAFDVWCLPMRAFEVLMDGYLDDIETHVSQIVFCTIDVVFFGVGSFLAITFCSNFSGIVHFFITDAVGKFQL